ncbi:MFS transporter [Legionella longbeachae]|uniref:Lysosomal dipeptide transporter MFSD1 n=1 Tax=Legionella longbeachae serogroup 1 (strain NSW150) TaxID=661367 RepID=D3HSP6_LEGLN|nr:MFS transporter [Legionella longbeachae]VEE02430.1 major facilitator family transporter (MFS) [Legionella oakridgensis]ARB91292.1 MFS transporter [Legionella longbeachae]ARM32284.1 MFS transporter [Legionella longbeachae]EEZ94929.1 major facilitator family protein [Legionella longbeachae D-4968]QIN32289.1 MFS transporter [Legionella longbeachae]
MGTPHDIDKTHNKITCRAVLIVSLCSAFLFYKYILQNFPSVMPQQLMEIFHLQGLGLGVLSGVYFWTYLIVPLFVGIILDQYGTRWITTGAIFCCALGIFIFSQAQELNTAIWGRALTGVGVSFASITYFKLAAVWFSKKYYALLTSLLVASGMIGAVCGQMPLAWLVSQVGWRTSLVDVAWLGVILAFLFLFIVKDQPAGVIKPIESEIKQTSTKQHLWQDILLILKNKQNWLLTGYSGLAFSPVVIFCGLWGNPFLQKAYELDKLLAPSLISLVFVGLAIACPLFALFVHRIQNRCAFMFYSTLVSALSISLVIFAHPMPLWLLSVLLFLFGFSLGAFPIVFVIGKESNPLYLAGTVTSLINASDAFLDAISEPAIGKLLDVFSSTSGATHDFSLSSYHIALAILPLYQIIGAFLMRWVKDEHRAAH